MQDKLKLEILKEGFQVQRESVEAGLASKATFVKNQYEKELTDAIFKRVKIEEEHIRNCIGLLETFDNLVKAFEDELQAERASLIRCRELNEMFAKDATDYRAKYYETILKLNESQINFRQP